MITNENTSGGTEVRKHNHCNATIDRNDDLRNELKRSLRASIAPDVADESVVRPADTPQSVLGDLPSETPAEIEKLKSALGVLTSDVGRGNGSFYDGAGQPMADYWLAGIWAIAGLEWPCGKDIARDWSQQCRGRYDDAEFEKAWGRYKPDQPNPVDIGSLYKRAMQAGWQSPISAEQLALNALLGSTQVQVQVLSPLILPVNGGLSLVSHGDIRNAKAFAHKWRGQLVCVTNRDKWLQWRDQKWQLCEKDEHVARAKQCCSDILAAANVVFGIDQEKGRRLVTDAMAAHNLPKINAMLKLAVSEPDMAVTDSELDADPMLLGVQNGLVELRSGHLLCNRPDMLVTRYCGAAFVKDAACPRWTSFLDQIFQSKAETIETVQRLLGYTLTGLVTEEILVVCIGYGSNGKSVFSNVVSRIMGGYSRTAPASLLTVRRSDDSSPRNDLASLAGARYVSISELQAGDRLDEQVVKLLAGREPIAARFLHKEFFEYQPTFTAWLRTNHKPIITGEDHGIWRRMVVLPFSRTFKDEEKDPFLEDKLMAESDGILQWMLEGVRLYLKDGLKLSPQIKTEVAKYRSDSDMLGEFLKDETTPGPTERVNQGLLYTGWRTWCENSGAIPGSKKTFTQRMAERGYVEGRSNGARFYVGLTWPGIHDSGDTGRVGRD
jgi:putative DNA primase/helicase